MIETLPGFQGQSVDVFLKLGGSLLSDLTACRRLGELLESFSARGKNIVVFPGGGPIDNYVEQLDADLKFEPMIHHNLCARAQDQTGLIFGSLVERRGFFSVPVELERIFQDDELAIMLPMRMIVELNVFEQSWRITSDTMAAFFSDLFGANRLGILTNVGGIYEDPNDPDRGAIPEVRASELVSRGRTSVDECLAPFLLGKSRRCDVLHGFDLPAIGEWLEEDRCGGTRILPE